MHGNQIGGIVATEALMPTPRQRPTPWGYIFDTVSPAAGVVAVASLLLTVLFSTKFVQSDVPFALLAGVVIVLLAVIAALAQALRAATAFGPHEAQLKVVKVVKPSAPFTTSICMCLVESAVPLAVTTQVMFLVEKDCERQLGWGWVRHQQADGLVQITLDGTHDGMEETVEALRRHDKEAVESLRVRFHLPMGALPPTPNAPPVTPNAQAMAPAPTAAPRLPAGDVEPSSGKSG